MRTGLLFSAYTRIAYTKNRWKLYIVEIIDSNPSKADHHPNTVFVIVRIYIIVEVFISFQPESAYDSVQWLSFIPHV